jgi:hypothetical protein
MSLTKKQTEIVDALHNGGFIWRASMSYYVAVVQGHMSNGEPRFQSELINARTFKAMEPDLEQFTSDKGGLRWRLK